MSNMHQKFANSGEKKANHAVLGKGARFARNWVAGTGDIGRTTRRRLMSVLRASCMVLGINRKSRGLGALGVAGIVAGLALPGVVSAQNHDEGPGSVATGTNSVAVGVNSTASGQNSTAVGSSAVAGTTGGGQSVAVGAYATAVGDQSTAMGNNAFALGSSGIVIGGDDLDKVASKTYTATINGSSQTGTGEELFTALTGSSAIANGTYHSAAAGDGSIAIGAQATAGAQNLGANAADANPDLTSAFDIAIGAQAKARGFSSVAIGTGATATGDASFALGAAARAEHNDALAIGSGAKALADSSFALGHLAEAREMGTISFGAGTVAGAERTIAIGYGAQATAADAMAFGAGAIADGEKAIAIGPNSRATSANDGTEVDFSTVGGQTGNIAGAIGSAAGVVSFGQAIEYQADPGAADGIARDVDGNPIVVNPGIQRQLQNVAPGRISDTSTDAVNGSQLNVTNQQVALNTQAGERAVKYDWTDTNGDGVVDPGEVDYGTATLAGDGAGNGTVLANVAAGQVTATSSEAVNGSQLYNNAQSVADNFGGGSAVNPDGTVSAPTYAVDGSGTTYNNVGDALTAVGAAANAGWNVTDAGGNAANIGPNGTVVFTGDSNVTVAQTGTDDAGAVTVTLNRDLDVDSVTAGGTVLDSTGLTIVGGPSVTTAGIDAGGAAITNVGAGVANTDAVNVGQLAAAGQSTAAALGGGSAYDPVTNVVTASLVVGGNAYTNVQDALVSLNSSATAGWNVTDANDNAANIGPNGTVAFTGDSNVTVTQTGTDNNGEVQVALNPDVDLGPDGSLIVGNTMLTTSGLVIAGGPSVTIAGVNAGGLTVTNVAAGELSATSTDAVNGAQLHETNTRVADVENRVTTVESRVDNVEGDVASIVNGEAGLVQQAGGASGSGDITIGKDSGGKLVNVAGTDGDRVITGVANGSIAADSTDAVNGSQLYEIGQTANAGWNVTTKAVGTGVVGGSTEANVAPGSTATFTAGNNIAITQIGTEVQVALNPDLKGVNSISVTNGPTIDGSGIDMHGDKITNVGAGTAPTDAVNVGQLGDALGQSFTYTDTRINALAFDLSEVRRDANAATASAMAMSQVPQVFEPGMGMVGAGVSTWQGQQAIAFGFSKASDNGRLVVKGSATVNSRGQGGGAVGAGIQF